MVTMVVFTLLDLTGIFHVGAYIYLATLGFIVTLVTAVIASLTAEPKYYGKTGWELVPNENNREDIDLEEQDKKILELLRVGHVYMRDYSDYFGLDSKVTNASIERLDRGGYLQRESLSGSGMYTFSITQKGLDALQPLTGAEKAMADEGLTPMYVQFLSAIATSGDATNKFIAVHGIKSMQLAAITANLAQKGYILEKGAFKRKMVLTNKGRTAIKKFA